MSFKIIFGLGNPEKAFDSTPHNCGFFAVDKLCSNFGGNFSKKKLNGLFSEIIVNGQKVLLVKPLTYMNNSGECVLKYVKKFKIPLENILVILDDIDLPIGEIRFRQKGSAGTHNGLKSVVACLNSTEFARLRIGVGKPPEHMDLADYVLKKFDDNQKALIEKSYDDIEDKVLDFLKN